MGFYASTEIWFFIRMGGCLPKIWGVCKKLCMVKLKCMAGSVVHKWIFKSPYNIEQDLLVNSKVSEWDLRLTLTVVVRMVTTIIIGHLSWLVVGTFKLNKKERQKKRIKSNKKLNSLKMYRQVTFLTKNSKFWILHTRPSKNVIQHSASG